MRRTSSHASDTKSKLSGSFARLFTTNPALLIGIAFEAGMLLGRYTKVPVSGRKVQKGASNFADQVLTLVPDSVTKLVPDIFPSKARKPARRKSSAKASRPARRKAPRGRELSGAAAKS